MGLDTTLERDGGLFVSDNKQLTTPASAIAFSPFHERASLPLVRGGFSFSQSNGGRTEREDRQSDGTGQYNGCDYRSHAEPHCMSDGAGAKSLASGFSFAGSIEGVTDGRPTISSGSTPARTGISHENGPNTSFLMHERPGLPAFPFSGKQAGEDT